MGRRRKPTKAEGVFWGLVILGAGTWWALRESWAAYWAAANEDPIGVGLVAGLVIGVALVVVTLVLHRRTVRRRRYLHAMRNLGFDRIDSMSGAEFERYVACIFEQRGYSVTHVGRTGDQGCDLILTRNRTRTACQVKRYADPVSNAAVQEVVAAMKFHRCSAAMVVTNNRFTRGASQLAAANGVRLVDRTDLANILAGLRAAHGE